MTVLSIKVQRKTPNIFLSNREAIRKLGGFKNNVLIGICWDDTNNRENIELLSAIIADFKAILSDRSIMFFPLDKKTSKIELSGVEWIDLNTDLSLTVYGSYIKSLIDIPDIFVGEVSIVLLNKAKKSNLYGILGPFLCQSGWALQRQESIQKQMKIECSYEFYKKVGCDLAISFIDERLCASKHKTGYILISNDALAIDIVLAKASSIVAQKIPHIKYSRSKNIIDIDNFSVEGDIPKIKKLKYNFLNRLIALFIIKIKKLFFQFKSDLRLAKQNLYRVRPFLQKIFSKE
jgi:uncharacterized protein YsxB (DUF464 family)